MHTGFNYVIIGISRTQTQKYSWWILCALIWHCHVTLNKNLIGQRSCETVYYWSCETVYYWSCETVYYSQPCRKAPFSLPVDSLLDRIAICTRSTGTTGKWWLAVWTRHQWSTGRERNNGEQEGMREGKREEGEEREGRRGGGKEGRSEGGKQGGSGREWRKEGERRSSTYTDSWWTSCEDTKTLHNSLNSVQYGSTEPARQTDRQREVEQLSYRNGRSQLTGRVSRETQWCSPEWVWWCQW